MSKFLIYVVAGSKLVKPKYYQWNPWLTMWLSFQIWVSFILVGYFVLSCENVESKWNLRMHFLFLTLRALLMKMQNVSEFEVKWNIHIAIYGKVVNQHCWLNNLQIWTNQNYLQTIWKNPCKSKLFAETRAEANVYKWTYWRLMVCN